MLSSIVEFLEVLGIIIFFVPFYYLMFMKQIYTLVISISIFIFSPFIIALDIVPYFLFAALMLK